MEKKLNGLGHYPVSTRLFWKKINKARHGKKTNSIPNLKYMGTIIKNDQEKADLFAEILSKIFKNDSDLSSFNEAHRIKIDAELDGIDFDSGEFDFVEAFGFTDLKNVIKNLKINSSPGEDQVHNLILKNLPDSFCSYFYNL